MTYDLHKAVVIDDMDDASYHAHPALSASGAKRLLPPSCPALFKHDRDNGGRPNKRAFDLGHAAHAAVLGVGMETVIVQRVTKDGQVLEAENYETKSAQAHRDDIYAAGKCPVLAKEKVVVDAMAAALRRDKRAAALLDPAHGRPEVSVFWDDEQRGIQRRARFDWLPTPTGGALSVPDYKTTTCAEPHAFARSMFSFGYDIQAVTYMDAVLAAGLAEDVRFVFIAQETTAPYLITLHELDYTALALGRRRVDEACATFRQCSETGIWPGYSDGIELVPPPAWLAGLYGLDDIEMAV
jgi:hypothetical protein